MGDILSYAKLTCFVLGAFGQSNGAANVRIRNDSHEHTRHPSIWKRHIYYKKAALTGVISRVLSGCATGFPPRGFLMLAESVRSKS